MINKYDSKTNLFYLMRAGLWVYAFYCMEDKRVQRQACALAQIRRNLLGLNALRVGTSTDWERRLKEKTHTEDRLYFCAVMVIFA